MKAIIVLLILVSFHNVDGQSVIRRNPQTTIEFNLQTGGTVFYGDISRRALLPQNRKNKKDFGIASSLAVMINNGNGIETRISVTMGTLNGIRYDVLGGYQRYFTNTFNEADATIAFDLFKDRKRFENLTIAWVMGFGVINYRTVLRSLLTNRLINTMGYAPQNLPEDPQLKPSDMRTDMVGITGGAVSYRIHENFEVSIEHTYRIATSSKLDAISGEGINDYYSYTSLGISYKIK
ncbi:MAG: hypothetical protein V4590_01380 [Bacteroidota bacterium]